MADPKPITESKRDHLGLQTNKKLSLKKPSSQVIDYFNAQNHLNKRPSTSLARDEIANKLSKDAFVIKKQEVAVTKETKKLFVKELSSTGANRVTFSFIGGRHIQVEAKGKAAFGHEGFAYKVSSFEYDNGGNRIPHMTSMNPTNGTFIVNTMNFGFGSTKYKKDHISPKHGIYAQKNFVEWNLTIPPQTSSNYNSGGFELNVYQIINK